jgi:predicted ATPase
LKVALGASGRAPAAEADRLHLARLCRDQDRRAEAHDLLAPVYGWFTEGFGTPDLKDSKALLEPLGA